MLARYELFARDEHGEQPVIDLLAFRCERQGHMFFVRKLDTAVFDSR